MALKRLNVERKKLKEKLEKGEIAGFDAEPRENDKFLWDATIIGPDDTPYAGGMFRVLITFPSDYPFKPPSAEFVTKIWHPAVSEKGELCLHMLDNWRPVYNIVDILLTLQQLIREPSPDDSLNSEAAQQFKNDKEKFNTTVEDWKKEFAL